MNKNIKTDLLVATTAVAGVSLVGALAPSQAQADEVAPQTTQATTQQTADQQAQAKVDQAQADLNNANTAVQQAQAGVNDAQANVNEAQSDLQDQQAKVNTAQQGVDQAQANVNTAQDKVTSAQNIDASPAAQEKAQQAVTDQTNKVAQDDQAIKAAQVDQTAAQQKVDQAQQAVNQDQNNVDTKTTNVATAQKNVDQAKDALDNDGLAAAQQAVTDAQNQVNKDQQAIKDGTSAVNKATSDQQNAQTNLTNKQKASNDAQQKLTQAKNDASAKQATADQTAKAKTNAQNAVNTTQSQIKTVQDQLAGQVENTIVIPQAAIDAYKVFEEAWQAYYNDNTDETKKAAYQNALDSLYSNLEKGYSINEYKHNEYDKTRQVNINSLSESDQQELSAFAADLINKARKNWGSDKEYGLVVPTVGITKMAKSISDGYREDEWTITNGHNVPQITKVAKEYGLNSDDNYYENAGQGGEFIFYNTKGVTTMDAIKAEIFDTISGMLFKDSDSQNGHMESLLGLDGYKSDYDAMPSSDKKRILDLELIL